MFDGIDSITSSHAIPFSLLVSGEGTAKSYMGRLLHHKPYLLLTEHMGRLGVKVQPGDDKRLNELLPQC